MSTRSLTTESVTRKLVNYLRNVANRRSSGYVTADDAHKFLTNTGLGELKIRTRLAYINSAFSNPAFEKAGITNSTRPAAKGRSISMWMTA